MDNVKTHDRQVIDGVTHLLAISSGKGGVGKSTISANLAAELARHELKVGLMDTDIYGPNIPGMLGLSGKPTVDPDSGHLIPRNAWDIKTISMGLLIDPGAPVIWRGPMLAKMIMQFLYQVAWGELDVLLIDLPPGTGDVQISLTQTAPLTAAAIVTTPSTIALQDVRRGIQMFRQCDVPILGIIQNMSAFVCDGCGQTSNIFGTFDIEHAAMDFTIPTLGQVPLEPALRISADEGKPLVLADPDAPASRSLKRIAETVTRNLKLKSTS